MPKTKLIISKKTGRRVTGTGLNKKQAQSVARIAKKVTLGLSETKVVGKQSAGSPTVPALALFHNQPLFIKNFLICQQGTADPNDYTSNTARIGDEIYLKNINIRFLLSSFRPNVTYKLVLFWYESNVAPTNATVYFTQGNKLLDRYNTESISIIDQKIIHPGAINRTGSDDNTTSFQRRTQLVTLNGSWKSKKIKYDENATIPKFKDIGVAVVTYDSVNTLQTDQLSELVYDYKIRFKDI